MMKKAMLAATVSLLTLGAGSAVNAATILVGASFEKTNDKEAIGTVVGGVIQIGESNDCSGYFGTASSDPDDWCDVGRGLDASVSPWIAKYDTPSKDEEGEETPGGWSTNMYFDTVDGSEWDLNGADGDSESGIWDYIVGAGDPAIRYWAAKAGTAFNLFWYVAEGSEKCSLGLDASNYTLDCLNEAIQVTSGSWFTPNEKGLSHITFYDSEPMAPIPLPAAGWLLLAGVGGLVAMRRKKAA